MTGAISAALTSVVPDTGAATAVSQGNAGSAPFSSVFRSLLSESAGLEQKAGEAVTGLLSGQGVELHDAMIATQKADMAFELALGVRNKAVAAYQQMMTMQF